MLLKKIEVKNNIKLDFFHLEEESDTNPDIFSSTKYKPKLNNYSKFLISFDDGTTISQGITNDALGYTFSVYRQRVGSNKLELVTKLDEGELSLADYNIKNNEEYEYYIFKESEDAMSEAAISNKVKPCWWNWSLTDLILVDDEKNYTVDTDNIWLFDLNLSTAETTQTFGNMTYNNFTRYPKVSFGRLNYSNGSITCLLGNLSKTSNNKIEYLEPATLTEKWNTFCNNGNVKLLKDRKGNAMLVSIISTSMNIEDESNEQVGSVTFSWTQVGDTNNIAIVKR